MAEDKKILVRNWPAGTYILTKHAGEEPPEKWEEPADRLVDALMDCGDVDMEWDAVRYLMDAVRENYVQWHMDDVIARFREQRGMDVG